MSDPDIRIDLSFLQVFSLIYEYEKSHDSRLLDPIIKALIRHKAVHPYLRTIEELAHEITKIDEVSLKLIEATDELMDGQWNESTPLTYAIIWDSVIQVVPILIVRMEFDQLNELLTKYLEMFQFTLQISSHDGQNFLEFVFCQLLAHVLQLVFQNNNHGYLEQPETITALFDATTVQDTLQLHNHGHRVQNQQDQLKQLPQKSKWMNLKAIESCLMKAETYYAKNEVVLTKTFNRELHYYYLMKWFTLFALFKEFKMNRFVEQFEQLYHQQSPIAKSEIAVASTYDSLVEYDENYSPFALFSSGDDYVSIRNLILTMYQVCLIVVKPFRELLLRETEDSLLDLFEANSVNSTIYYELMLSLKKSDFDKFKQHWCDLAFQQKMNLILINYLPELNNWDFFTYVQLLIDFKNFLAIISVTEVIPKLLMIKKLGGYKEKDETVLPYLLQLMAVLKLGEVGISYNINEGEFINNPTLGRQISALATKENIDVLRDDLQRESLALVISGLMIYDFAPLRNPHSLD